MDRVLKAKFYCPPTRPNWIHRERLLAALDRAVRRPVTLVSAPAGYGKTTLLAQWLARTERPPTAWLSLDHGDDDPDRFWGHVAVALARAGCALPTREASAASGPPGSTFSTRSLLPAVVSALNSTPDEIVLVLDDFHAVQERACHEQVQHLIANLAPHAHLVLVTRSDPGLRLGRLRASGDLAEFRAHDLKFTEAEAAELLEGDEIQVTDASLTTLMDRTEGWPAGLYLAVLSLAGLDEPDEFIERFGGGNRFIGDYLIEEVLSRQSDRVRDFITTASFLDRFSAPLCDHVAGTNDSATILDDLVRSNAFVVPLDEENHWFRFHHLFAAVARSEFETRDPRAVRLLHSRAAEWFRAHGHIDSAVENYLAAGESREAAHLLQANWLTLLDAGRAATVNGWLAAIDGDAADADPEVTVTAAWMSALAGDLPALTRHLATLAEIDDVGPLPDGTRSVRSAILLIRGTFAYDGPLGALEAAQRAVELETDPRSPFYAIAHLALGHAAYLLGDLDEAMVALREALRSEALPVIVEVQSLSLKSLIANEREDDQAAMELAERALQVVEAQGLRASPSASLALTAGGLVQAAKGNVEEALRMMEEDLDPRRQPRAQTSWASTHHLLATARVAAQAGRFTLAQELTAEVLHRVDRFAHGTEAMHLRVAKVQTLLRDASAAEKLGEPLTSRELDVLRLLQSDLTPHEMADELYLTLNTVKTHASAIYRKLGAHSRSEAVLTARRHSLI